MAKSSKNQPLLSPENYIRQKVRNLPIHNCYVSKDWKENGMCTVIVTRLHANGKITYGIYLVDLYCLGIKSSHYVFSESQEELEEMILHNEQEDPLLKADYTLAHNIIYAAHDFAMEIGIEPCKEFKITRFILEEDDDRVELMDIECGKSGKPFFIYGDDMPRTEVNRIKSLLEKSQGTGNYFVLNLENSEDESNEDSDNANDFLYEDEYEPTDPDEIEIQESFNASWQFFHDMEPEVRKNEFLIREKAFTAHRQHLETDHWIHDEVAENGSSWNNQYGELCALADIIIAFDAVDDDRVASHLSLWIKDWKDTLSDDFYHPTKLGLPASTELTDQDLDEFEALDDLMAEGDPLVFNKALLDMRAKWGDIAYLDYFSYYNCEIQERNIDRKTVLEMLDKHNGYPLFKLDLYNLEISEAAQKDKKAKYLSFAEIFPGDYDTSYDEFHLMLMYQLLAISCNEDLDALYSLYSYINPAYVDVANYPEIIQLYRNMQIKLLNRYFSK